MTYREKLEESLERYFDIGKNRSIGNIDFDFSAKFSQRNAQYVLVKKAEVYAFENTEYIFYKDIESENQLLDVEKIVFNLKESIDSIVNLNEEHMETIVTVILAGKFKPDIEYIKKLEKAKFHKSYKLGLKGWSNLKLFYVDTENKEVHSNKMGKKEKEKFKKLI